LILALALTSSERTADIVEIVKRSIFPKRHAPQKSGSLQK
jgi:hypothetical protein